MRVYEKSGKFYYEFMVNGKRYHRSCPNCKTQSSAMNYACKEYSRISESFSGITANDITVSRMFEIFLNYSRVNKSAISYRSDLHFVKILSPFFGPNSPITYITPSRINEFKVELVLNQKRSNATFNRYFSALSKAFNLVIMEYRLNYLNPCKIVGKMEENNKIERYLSEDEEKRLMEHLPSYLKPIVICALTTGLRLSNVLDLKWESINLEYNFIEILKQENKGHKKIQLPLSKKFKDVLVNDIGVKKSGYVFVNPSTGTCYNNIHKGFKNACKNAGIENFRFHDLRHTVATRLVANGSDLMTVKQFMAHSCISTTQRYMHPTPENMKNAVDILDNF